MFGCLANDQQPLALVLEACPGSLQDLVGYAQTHRALPLVVKVGVALQVAYGLRYLHSHDLCHGNLHPGNVMMTADLKPRLTDVQMAGAEQRHLHRAFSSVFIAPEERESGSVHTAAGDVFSLGRLLLWLLRDGKSVDGDLKAIPVEAVRLMIQTYTAVDPKVRK